MALPVRTNSMAATGTAIKAKTVAAVTSGAKLRIPKMNNAHPMVMKMVDATHAPTSRSMPTHQEAKPGSPAFPFPSRFLDFIAVSQDSREDAGILRTECPRRQPTTTACPGSISAARSPSGHREE